MIGKVDFEEALKKDEWNIHEFVCYINNDISYQRIHYNDEL